MHSMSHNKSLFLQLMERDAYLFKVGLVLGIVMINRFTKYMYTLICLTTEVRVHVCQKFEKLGRCIQSAPNELVDKMLRRMTGRKGLS